MTTFGFNVSRNPFWSRPQHEERYSPRSHPVGGFRNGGITLRPFLSGPDSSIAHETAGSEQWKFWIYAEPPYLSSPDRFHQEAKTSQPAREYSHGEQQRQIGFPIDRIHLR